MAKFLDLLTETRTALRGFENGAFANRVGKVHRPERAAVRTLQNLSRYLTLTFSRAESRTYGSPLLNGRQCSTVACVRFVQLANYNSLCQRLTASDQAALHRSQTCATIRTDGTPPCPTAVRLHHASSLHAYGTIKLRKGIYQGDTKSEFLTNKESF